MFDTKDFVDKLMENASAALIIESAQARLKTEQERRRDFYETITESDKVEFINGEIEYHSPVVKKHNDATGLLYMLLSAFARVHQLGFVGIEKIMVSLTRNDYEPDICFFNNEKAKDFTGNQMLFPVPDFVVEVLSKSPKSLQRDRVIKFDDYEAHGVAEYWMIDPDEETVEQYVLQNGKYQLVLKATEGHVRSHVVEGFVIPIPAIFDEKANLEALRSLI